MPLTTSHWPADEREPLVDTTVGDLLRRAAAEAPERTALIAADGTWSFAALLADAERCAGALAARFRPGERIAVWAPNSPEWVIVEYGAALAGLVLVPLNPALKPAEAAYVLQQSGSAGLFHAEEFRGNPIAQTVELVRPDLPALRETIPLSGFDAFRAGARAALPGVRPGDAAMVQYTSGTTGFPKGAVLCHRAVVNTARFTALRAGFSGGVWLNPMPLFHVGGCVAAVLGPASTAGTLVLMEAFEPGAVLDLVETTGADTMGSVPTMLVALMEHPAFAPERLRTLRTVLSGGATVPVELVRRVESVLGCSFLVVFGQTETSGVVTMTHSDDAPEDKAAMLGRPLPHAECRIVDPRTGETVPTGAVGEFCVRGYQTMLGYLDMPEATAQASDADGWLHTGDLCAMDERGFFTIAGRLKEVIIRAGENVFPREVEERLGGHPAVAEAAVLGVPDPKWGERVAAVVRFAAGERPAGAELRAWCSEQLASFKVPERWYAADAFPMTASGKVQRFMLRELIEKGGIEPVA